MNKFSLSLLVFMWTASIVGSNAHALSCSKKEISVCVIEQGLETIAKDLCIELIDFKKHTKKEDYKEFFIGKCSEFDSKKIETFACNAGLRFLENSTTANRTDQKSNFFNFSVAENDGSENPSFLKKTLNASNNSLYNEVSTIFGSKILAGGSELQFNFGSDYYGAEYFVDICIVNKNTNPERFDFNLSGKVIFSQSVFTNFNYNSTSQLLNKVDLICLNSNDETLTRNLSNESSFFSSEKSFSRVVSGSERCFVRHSFREGATLKQRENSFKKVTFQTQLNLSPIDESLLLPKDYNLCKIKVNGQDRFTCTSWKTNSEAAFIEELVSSRFIDKDVQTGLCPTPCSL